MQDEREKERHRTAISEIERYVFVILFTLVWVSQTQHHLIRLLSTSIKLLTGGGGELAGGGGELAGGGGELAGGGSELAGGGGEVTGGGDEIVGGGGEAAGGGGLAAYIERAHMLDANRETQNEFY
jgi:hypothetical protein